MNVTRFVKDYDRSIKSQQPTEDLIAHHRKQVEFLHGERLVHLLVTLAVALFALLSAGFAVAAQSVPAWALTGLFLLLLVPYIWHYFLLENAVQSWYLLLLEMEEKVGSD